MKSKEGAFFFLSTLFLLSSLAFNVVFFNIAKFKPDAGISQTINNGVRFDFLDESKVPLFKGLNFLFYTKTTIKIKTLNFFHII